MIAVLVVDDHAAIQKSLQYLIRTSDDIQVLAAAANGEEVVAHAGSRCLDVIVMDISMPQMDVIEATRQILVQCPSPVVRTLLNSILGWNLKENYVLTIG